MNSRPTLADGHPTKTTYQPGDRILARVSCCLSLDEYHRIKRAVKKYTREDVRVLIVDCTQVKILWKHSATQAVETLVCPKDVQAKHIDRGVVNLDCSVTDLRPGDTLMVFVPSIKSDLQRRSIVDWMQQWTGRDIEIVVLEAGNG